MSYDCQGLKRISYYQQQHVSQKQKYHEFVNLFWFGNNQHYYTVKFENKVIDENEKLTFPDGCVNLNPTLPNVHAILFMNCKIMKIPQKLTESFPNLRVMSISKCNLKCLSKEDLAEYKNLEHFSCNGNNIEFLPGDLFENFKNLKSISFFDNNLKFIEPNILDGLEKLIYVDFRKNPKYNKCFSVSPQMTYNHCSYEGVRTWNNGIANLNTKSPNNQKNNSANPYGYSQPVVQANAIADFDLSSTLQEIEEDLYEKFCLRFKKIHDSKVFKQENNLFNDVKNFTQDETFKDFKIIIDDREFPVHKFLLAARSPTLAEMLRNNPEAENLKLVDISVEIFELILKFLYTDEFPNDIGTNFMHLFIAAGRMELTDLKNFAAVKLFDTVNAESALETLNLSNKYGQDELRKKAFDEIKKNYPKIKFKDEFAKDGEKVLKIIEAFKAREELIKTADEEFEKLLI